MTWQPLSDEEGEFCALLTEYLDKLERLGIEIVLFRPIVNRFKGTRGPARAAGLPDWLTLDACRRAGLNEIADSDLTETQEMAMSGHTTPNAKRRYIKRSEAQRLIAARKRRTWIAEQDQERKEERTRNTAPTRTRHAASGGVIGD